MKRVVSPHLPASAHWARVGSPGPVTTPTHLPVCAQGVIEYRIKEQSKAQSEVSEKNDAKWSEDKAEQTEEIRNISATVKGILHLMSKPPPP